MIFNLTFLFFLCMAMSFFMCFFVRRDQALRGMIALIISLVAIFINYYFFDSTIVDFIVNNNITNMLSALDMTEAGRVFFIKVSFYFIGFVILLVITYLLCKTFIKKSNPFDDKNPSLKGLYSIPRIINFILSGGISFILLTALNTILNLNLGFLWQVYEFIGRVGGLS